MRTRHFFVFFLILLLHRAASAEIVFDTFTGPDIGGGSSPGGVATPISASQDVPITNIGILNRMQEPGHIRFVIFAHPTHELLYLSDESFYPQEAPNVLTWKVSPAFNFTLLGGKEYDIGYIHDGLCYDVLDQISESYNGLTTELWIAVTGGDFQNPTLDTHFYRERDGGVRLYRIPEPSMPLLLLALYLPISVRRASR